MASPVGHDLAKLADRVLQTGDRAQFMVFIMHLKFCELYFKDELRKPLDTTGAIIEPQDRMISVHEAAVKMGVSDATVRALKKLGKIQTRLIGSKRYKVIESSVNDLIYHRRAVEPSRGREHETEQHEYRSTGHWR